MSWTIWYFDSQIWCASQYILWFKNLYKWSCSWSLMWHMHTMMYFSSVKYVSPPHCYIRYVSALLQHNEDETLHVPQMGVKEGFRRQTTCLIAHVPPSRLHMEEMRGRRRKLKEECRTRARKGLTYQQEFNTRSPRAAADTLLRGNRSWMRRWDPMATVSECVWETAISISHRFIRLVNMDTNTHVKMSVQTHTHTSAGFTCKISLVHKAV